MFLRRSRPLVSRVRNVAEIAWDSLRRCVVALKSDWPAAGPDRLVNL
jgi:hypothetical protein